MTPPTSIKEISMPRSPRRLLALALALGVASSAALVPAMSAAQDDAGGEILLQVAYTWKVKGTKVTGTVTNDDSADARGTAKVTRRAGGRTTTFATGGTLRVAAGRKQTLTLTLTKAGRSWFKRHGTASAELVMQVTAGTRSGDVSNEIRLRRA